jgi:hypothetical protein
VNRADRRALLKPAARRWLARQRQRQAAQQAGTPLPDGLLTDVGLAMHQSLLSVQHGQADEQDANNLALAANVSLLLCELGLGGELQADVIASQAALVQMSERNLRLNRYVATGPELQALNRLGEIHDAQLSSPDCTQGLLAQAMALIRRRVAEGHVMRVAGTPAPVPPTTTGASPTTR